MSFFLKKYSDSQCCWKKYSDFGGGKFFLSDSEFLPYNLANVKFWKKNYVLTLVLSEKKILNETKNHTIPDRMLNRLMGSHPSVLITDFQCQYIIWYKKKLHRFASIQKYIYLRVIDTYMPTLERLKAVGRTQNGAFCCILDIKSV